MAFILLIIGITLIASAVNNTADELTFLLKADFTGPANFGYWVLAILVIGAIGYVDKLKPVSDTFLVLIILVLFLAKGKPGSATGGFFQKFTQAIGTSQTTSALPQSNFFDPNTGALVLPPGIGHLGF